MSIYKDFLGLNYCIYDPCETDSGSFDYSYDLSTATYAAGSNTLGYHPANIGRGSGQIKYNYDNPVGYGHISQLTSAPASYLARLNLHRNGAGGYSSWKQIRSSQNHLIRSQKKDNIFTYVQIPGNKFQMSLNGRVEDRLDRYGKIKRFTEPPVVSSYKPLVVIGKARVYSAKLNKNILKTVQIKTSFDNETTYFSNEEVNKNFETFDDTHENYEDIKELYLNDGLADDGSPIDEFVLLTYRQTVYPKMSRSYLEETRMRTFYTNTFWRDSRKDRTLLNQSNGFGNIIPSQSMWPLDTREEFIEEVQNVGVLDTHSNGILTALWPIGWNLGKGKSNANIYAFNSGFDLEVVGSMSTGSVAGGEGLLNNSYSQMTRGYLTSNAFHSPAASVNPAHNDVDYFLAPAPYYGRIGGFRRHGPSSLITLPIAELGDYYGLSGRNLQEWFSNNGQANWVAPEFSIYKQRPFYDSYEEFSRNIRIKGKEYSILPEFRISSHVSTYESLGVTDELKPIFELSGATSQNTTTENESRFYEIYSNSDFLKSFELIRNDHKDFSSPSIVTLRCKAIKKFLPYEGFYPCQRTTQITQQFHSSYKDHIQSLSLGSTSAESANYGIQAILQPLFAPGILFNTIKSGVACDFPTVLKEDSLGSAKFQAFGSGSFTSLTDPAEVNTGDNQQAIMITGSSLNASSSARGFEMTSMFSERIPFEALVDPEAYLANKSMLLNEVHPFSLFTSTEITSRWDGQGDSLYVKMMNNFLAEVPEFFLKNQNFTTISSLESSNPQFGNAVSGTFYTMRVKMYKSRNQANDFFIGSGSNNVMPPQDNWGRLWNEKDSVAPFNNLPLMDTISMYSNPTSFGPPLWSGGSGSFPRDGTNYPAYGNDSQFGFNYPYTPPYYHGEGWTDLIFKATETRKYTLDEILSQCREYPYSTRFWFPTINDAYRDLVWNGVSQGLGVFTGERTGPYEDYGNSPWREIPDIEQPALNISAIVPATSLDNKQWGEYSLNGTSSWIGGHDFYGPQGLLEPGKYGPQHPSVVNFNAMQLESSVNLFGKGIMFEKNLDADGTSDRVEVFSSATNDAKSRWVIQSKFETPILNFIKYGDVKEDYYGARAEELGMSDEEIKLKKELILKRSTLDKGHTYGMWKQFGDIPAEQDGVFLQVDDIPSAWLGGALGIGKNTQKSKIRSLADLVGFDKTPKKMGQLAKVKQISEAVVAVPFIEKEGVRKFFTIPRKDIDDTISALRREIEPGVFILGGPPKVGKTIIDMVKKMRRYVFPPSMDFVRYNQIQPFSMYIFEFTHNLTSLDLSHIWQNLPPKIGTSFQEVETSISHELLAHELLGGGAVIKEGKLDENAIGNEIPSKIQWMVFKVKKRAITKYEQKVVEKTGQLPKPALQLAAEREEDKDRRAQGEDPDITYNWPYDFFSLVELVKLDAEISFSDLQNDDKGNKIIQPIKRNNKSIKEELISKRTDIAAGRAKKDR